MESEDFYPRILSIDGGGVRGLSSLLILRQIMDEIGRRNRTPAPLPCEYFEMIGGTSTGGIIAIMLGRLRMVLERLKPFNSSPFKSASRCISSSRRMCSKWTELLKESFL